MKKKSLLFLSLWLMPITLGSCRVDIENVPPDERSSLGETDEEPTDFSLDTTNPREYFRWPRRLIQDQGEKKPDSDWVEEEEDPNPIFYDETVRVEQGEYIRIGSFNLKGFGFKKSERIVVPQGVNASRRRHSRTRDFIADYVSNMGLDVVVFIEVVGDDKVFRRLKSVMKEHGYELAVGDGDDHIRVMRSGNKEWCPIFYKTDTIRPETGGGRRPIKGHSVIADIDGVERRMTYAYLGVVPRQGSNQFRFKFTVAGMHAPPPGAVSLDKVDYFRGIPNAVSSFDWDTDIIITGDFNANPRDSSEAVQDRWNPVWTVGGFLNLYSFTNFVEGRGTSIFNENIYDDLLWRLPTEEDYAGLKVIEYGFDELFRNQAGDVDKQLQNRMSDHYPVWAKFHKWNDRN